MDYFEELCRVGLDESLWTYSPVRVRTREEMHQYIQAALKSQDDGVVLPFVTIDKASDDLVGSTRYLNIDVANRRLEIGGTWVVPQWQKSYVNTESKYLLLRHAFEELGCTRVEFKTDSLNEKSRRALLRIGATEEGIFRNHMVMPDGRLRHSAYYSIIDSEWPEIKKRIEQKMK